jgi:hypothetical protein
MTITKKQISKIVGKKLVDTVIGPDEIDRDGIKSEAAVTYLRIDKPGSLHTCDWNPNRLNVHVDEHDCIINLTFG